MEHNTSRMDHEADALSVCDAADDDVIAIRDIYAHYVRRSLATFEETVPTLEDMRARHERIVGLGLPYLVAVRDGSVIGFSYASEYRARSAYRYTIEDSVYVADGLTGGGIGSRLLATLIARCEGGPWRQMVAVIGDSANVGSIALHRRLGFAAAGVLRAVGFKHDRWVDTVLMQRPLGAPESPPR